MVTLRAIGFHASQQSKWRPYRMIPGKGWVDSIKKSTMPGNFKHWCAMQWITDAWSPTDACGEAPRQLNSRIQSCGQDKRQRQTGWQWKWQSKSKRRKVQMELSHIRTAVRLATATCWIKLRQLWWSAMELTKQNPKTEIVDGTWLHPQNCALSGVQHIKT